MGEFKNFLFPKIDFKRDIIRAKIWFPYGKRLLANNMTGQADVTLCKLGGGWQLEAKKQKKNNAWSQVIQIDAARASKKVI